MSKDIKVVEEMKETRIANQSLRANAFPADGFSMVVDGKFKSHHGSFDAAQKTALDLKTRFPLLQIMVRDDVTTVRSEVELLTDEP